MKAKTKLKDDVIRYGNVEMTDEEIAASANPKVRTTMFLEADLIRVKGKIKPAHIYALLGGPELKKSEDFKRLAACHQNMLEAYRDKNWVGAKNRFAA